MTDELRYRTALRKVLHEVEHKHGGPEKSNAVSVPYLYGIVMEALELAPQPKCEKCFKKKGPTP